MNDHERIYDITWNWPVFVSQLFAFAIIVGALSKWVLPQVRRMMRNAQGTIAAQIEESAGAAAELAAAKAAFGRAAEAARAEVVRIEHDARHDAERILSVLRETAAAEVERVRREGERNVATVRRQLEHDLVSELAHSVLDRTETAMREMLSTSAAQSGCIDRFLEELDREDYIAEVLSR
ncbi:F0F1 ATP synthase subunit B family protein [Nocardia sp. NPDC055321]